MANPRLALSEPLFLETSGHAGHGSVKVSTLVCILSILALTALFGSKQHLNFQDPAISMAALPSQVRAPQLSQVAQQPLKMQEQVGRRVALASGLAAASAVMAPKTALADVRDTKIGVNGAAGGGRYNVLAIEDPELAVKVVQEQEKKNKEEKARRKVLKERTPEEIAAEEAKNTASIQYAIGGGLALSVPFFAANLQRLGIKVASGGKEDGYDRIPAGRTVAKKKGAASKAKKGPFR